MPKIKLYIVVELAAALLLLLFVYTAINKLIDLAVFRGAIRQSPLLKHMAGFISIALPVTELVVAGLLFFPRTKERGLLASFVLMSLLTLYLIYMVLFSPDRPCSCGGVLKSMTWKQHIVFNLFFTALAFTGWRFSRIKNLITKHAFAS